jgi:hypothetical protein
VASGLLFFQKKRRPCTVDRFVKVLRTSVPDSVHSPASDGTTRRSSSRRAATVVGRMYLEGILTEAEAAAGFLYAENMVRTRLKQGRRRGLRFLDGHLQVTSLLVAANPRNI